MDQQPEHIKQMSIDLSKELSLDIGLDITKYNNHEDMIAFINNYFSENPNDIKIKNKYSDKLNEVLQAMTIVCDSVK